MVDRFRYRYENVHRLEPAAVFTDLARGWRAEVADPVWFLGQQWRRGEHHGENAATPVRVNYQATVTPIDPPDTTRPLDPRTTPAEAIVEAQPGDWWTPGRRVRIGRHVEHAAAGAGRPLPDHDATLRLRDLPVPYDVLDGTGFDGRILYERRAKLRLKMAWFPDRPPASAPRDLWNPAELAYDADFTADGAPLTLRRHDGGELDWFSVDAKRRLPEPRSLPAATSVLPSRLRYLGAPEPRLWAIEDARVDLGGAAPDSSHLATLLLLELVCSHSDDWYTFPVTAPTGHVLTVHQAVVHDALGGQWPLSPPKDGWTLFAVQGLDQRCLVLWPTVATPLAGPVIDQVDLGIDEDANLVWAVERRLDGHDLPSSTPALSPSPLAAADASTPLRYDYHPGLPMPPYWHPYVLEETGDQRQHRRWFVQGRLVDLSGPTPQFTPEPQADLLYDPALQRQAPFHRIDPAAIPPQGVRLERNYLLARRTDGTPVLWTQRRRQPLTSPPALRLRFDNLEPVAAEV